MCMTYQGALLDCLSYCDPCVWWIKTKEKTDNLYKDAVSDWQSDIDPWIWLIKDTTHGHDLSRRTAGLLIIHRSLRRINPTQTNVHYWSRRSKYHHMKSRTAHNSELLVWCWTSPSSINICVWFTRTLEQNIGWCMGHRSVTHNTYETCSFFVTK